LKIIDAIRVQLKTPTTLPLSSDGAFNF